MWTLRKSIAAFVFNDDGPTAVEYAIMLALIVIVCLASIKLVGNRTDVMYDNVATELMP